MEIQMRKFFVLFSFLVSLILAACGARSNLADGSGESSGGSGGNSDCGAGETCFTCPPPLVEINDQCVMPPPPITDAGADHFINTDCPKSCMQYETDTMDQGLPPDASMQPGTGPFPDMCAPDSGFRWYFLCYDECPLVCHDHATPKQVDIPGDPIPVWYCCADQPLG
jgi:hypothetical protein